MFFKRYYLLILLLLAIAIKIFSLFPASVEKYYTGGIYPAISALQRFLFGWIPFSVGDILYALAVVYLVMGVVRFARRLLKRNIDRRYLLRSGRLMLVIFLWVYILFNGLWGLNYNRIGIAQQMGLKVTAYTATELASVVMLTMEKLHQLDSAALSRRELFQRKNFLFNQAVISYKEAVQQLPFLTYDRPSIKPSIFSYLGNYLGYSGYYNPFSGEAQVNTAAPLVLQPFTTSHEIGHQLGFAKENEANFVSYLAARHSPDPAVQYSVYFDLYIYAYRNLAAHDSALAKALQKKLPAIAKKDLKDLKEFYERHENPFEPLIRSLYGQYLKANEQPQGILSYDEVIAWVIAFYRKFKEV